MRSVLASSAGLASLRRAAVAVALALALATGASASASTPITRADFIEAYVACNNAAWTNPRQQIVLPERATRSDEMRGLDSRAVRGFVGENLYYDGVMSSVEPRRTATMGWALATKAFADRGESDPRYRDRRAANALLRRRALRGIDGLTTAQAAAIATELRIATADRGRNAITPIAAHARLDAPLDAQTARAMLSKIGTHFDAGGPNAGPQPGIACPIAVYATLFRGKT